MGGVFSGKTVLVTGGARGVGRQVTEEFAARGAHVVVNYFHSADQAAQLLDELTGRGLSAELIKASMAKADQVEDMMRRIRSAHDGLDVVVNNAARGVFCALGELEEEDWQRALELNLHGVRRCCLAALPLLVSRPGSSIVNVSSHGSTHVVSDYGLVGTTKAAMESLSRYLAVEFAPHGVRVNVAACQVMDNRVGDLFPRAEQMKETTRSATPLGRLPTEQDLARLIVLLALPEAGFVTGQTVLADGGLSLGAALHAPLTSSARSQSTDRPTERSVDRLTLRETEPSPGRPLVAIVGTGLLLPEINSPEEFWARLQTDEPVFSTQDAYARDDFYDPDPAAPDTAYTLQAGVIRHPLLHPRANELEGARKVERWLRHCAAQALDDVRVPDVGRTSVYFAGWPDGTTEMEEGALLGLLASASGCPVEGPIAAALPRADRRVGRYLPSAMLRRCLAGLVNEPDVVTIDAACASGLYAVDLAARALLDSRADLALASGLSLCTVRYQVLFSKVTGLSRSGDVRAFDEAADGTLFSDSAACIALKRLDDAERDGDQVLGVLAGFGASSDGKGKGIYAPNERGQRRALERAYGEEGMRDVSWVVAHATGTPAGDAAELSTVSELADHALCTGNKSLVGHGGWTSGLTSLIHATLGLRHELIPGQARLDASLSRPQVPTGPVAFPATRTRRVGVSAFGFGGINGHAVLVDQPDKDDRSARATSQDELVVVGWSAAVPGFADPDGALANLRSPDLRPSFGSTYPAPPISVVRMPPKTVRAIDRTQVMALEAIGRFALEHGALWQQVADQTCVIAAHSGPTRLSQEAALRCFRKSLDRALASDPSLAEWWLSYQREFESQIPPISEDTLPGLLPNVIGGRIANYYDIRGPSLVVDDGLRSGRAAFSVARQYVASGECELALLVGAHGNTLPGCGELFGVADEAMHEGIFVLGLALRATASRHGWPVVGELAADPQWPEDPATSPCFGGAQDIAFLLGDTVADGAQSLFRSELTTASEAPVEHSGESVPALPSGCLVLTDDAELEARLPESDVTFVDIGRPIDREALERLASGVSHVRVFADLARTPWPAPPDESLIRLQEATFLTLQMRADSLQSLVVCVRDPQPGGSPNPHGGLFTGLVKSACWDLPNAWLHVLTTDAEIPEALEQLAAESLHRPEIPVSFVRHGLRHTETLVPVGSGGSYELNDGSVIVAVGGARGITATLLQALAEAKPHLWLIGTSDPAQVTDEQLEEDDEVFAARRRGFISELMQTEPGITPVEAVCRFDRLAGAREVARNLDRLEEICGPGRVNYLRADVTLPEEVEAAATRITDVHAHIDLLINAAGLHEAADPRNKSLDSFRRVRDVKLRGYHALRSAFEDVEIARWCNFGSITGVVGLPGEIDYAAANDLLGAAARFGHRRPGCEEFTVAWTMWGQSGMATRGLIGDAVKRRGHLSSITDAEGISHFRRLLGHLYPLVTQIGAAERRFLRPLMPQLSERCAIARVEPAGAFLRGVPDRRRVGYGEWDLDFTNRQADLVSEHPVTGMPTLPGTLVLALLAEAAARLVPDRLITAVRDVRFHQFIRVRPGSPVRYRVHADLTGPDTVAVKVTSDVRTADGRLLRRDVPHAEGYLELDSPRRLKPKLNSSAGKPAEDPYYLPESPIPIRGAFVNTVDLEVTSEGGRCRWLPSAMPDASFYGRMSLPALLIDAMARTHTLREPGTAQVAISAPVALERLELYESGSDVDFLRRHPDGIELVEDRAAGLYFAFSRTGTPLLAFSGMEIYSVGEVAVPDLVSKVP